MCTHMLGKAEGYALSLLEQYETAGWPSWEDMTNECSEEAITETGLKNLIDCCFTQGNQPEVMLWKLCDMKQRNKDIEDFITEFENMKLLAKISDDHAIEILQQNVCWDYMEKFVTVYGPLANY